MSVAAAARPAPHRPTAHRPAAHLWVAGATAVLLVLSGAVLLPGAGRGTALGAAVAGGAAAAGFHTVVMLLSRERLRGSWLHESLDVLGAVAASLAIMTMVLLRPLQASDRIGADAVLLVPAATALVVVCVAVTTSALAGAPRDPRQVAVGAGVAALLVAEALRLADLVGWWELPVVEGALRAAAGAGVLAAVAVLRGPGATEVVHEDAHVLSVGPAVITAVACTVLLAAHLTAAPTAVVVAAVVAVLAAAAKSLLVYRRITALNVSHEQARTDDLTGLGNRRALMARLDAAPQGAPVVLALVDLDRFKAVNDALGHDAGDELLRQVASRLRSLARAEDLVARQGGDEFAIVMGGAAGTGGAAAAGRAREVVAALEEPFVLHPRTRRSDGGHERDGEEGSDHDPARGHGQVVRIGASVGVAARPHDAASTEALLRAADGAMYRAKHAGGGVRVHVGPEAAGVVTAPGGRARAGTRR